MQAERLGLSGSIQAAITLMAIWDRMAKAGYLGVETGGLIDDTNMRAKVEDAMIKVMKAWNESKRFDRMVGMETNKATTKAYTLIPGREKIVK